MRVLQAASALDSARLVSSMAPLAGGGDRAPPMLFARRPAVIDLDQRAGRVEIAPWGAVASKAAESHVMEAVYFTLTAIVCYLLSDWILRRMEAMAGRRFEHRTLVFFAIILGLALVSFALVRNFAPA
jgi:hypothetical protein